jgi:uncharacterized protein
MLEVIIAKPASYRSMPWRNGLGSTLELLKQDLPGGDGFAWRLSMAEVSSDGEFSNFSGYDRTLLLLEGNGMTLLCDGHEQRLCEPLQAARFRGEGPTRARLHDGPIKDFNIMTQRQYCQAYVTSQSSTAPSAIEIDTDILLIYAVEAELRVDFDRLETWRLPARHLLISHNPTLQKLRCGGGSHIITQINYLNKT